MEKSYGVQIHEPLLHWKEILFKWREIIDRICPIMLPNDRPWWESEVAQAGILAAAGIHCGVGCFLETKVEREGRKGKGDIWVKFPDGFEEFVELKIDDIKDGNFGFGQLDQALMDARSISEKFHARIGGCLYKVSGQSPEQDILSILQKFYHRQPQPHAVAWSFPECARNDPVDPVGNLYSVGAILVLQKVDDC